MVGRESELGRLRSDWAAARDGGGSIVLVEGEAGIGKSRLIGALIAEVGREASVLGAGCSPYLANTPLSPLIQVLEETVLRSGDPPTRRRRLLELFDAADVDPDEGLPLLGPLIGVERSASPIPAEEALDQLLDLSVRMLRQRSRHRPMLVVVEDVHWADQASQQLLARFADGLDGSRVLVVATSRPDAEAEWRRHRSQPVLRLGPLDDAAAAALASAVTGGRSLGSITAEVVARADGVPLFLEELSRWAIDHGPGGERAVPPTLHDALVGRLDRLGPGKRVAQLASVVAFGAEFGADDVVAAGELELGAASAALDRLVEAGVLDRRTSDGGSLFRFRHALIGDAAYESMLRSERRRAHHRVAEALDQRPGVPPEVNARHRTAAGDHREAMIHWRVAGESARQRGAFGDAEVHLTQAAALWERDTDALEVAGAAELYLELADVRAAAAGYTAAATEHAYARALELSSDAGGGDRRLRALFGLNTASMSRGDQRRALASAEEMVAEAERLGDRRLRVRALNSHGTASMLAGRLAPAIGSLQTALDLHDRSDEQGSRGWSEDQEASNACMLSLALAWAGEHRRSDTARRLARRATSRSDHPLTTALVLGAVGCIDMVRRDADRLTATAEELAEVSSRFDLPWWGVWVAVFEGWVAAVTGDRAGAQAMVEAMRLGGPVETGSMRPFFLAQLAEVALVAGDPTVAAEALDEGFRLVSATGEEIALAELWRVRGRLQDDDAALVRAGKIARRQGALTLELRVGIERAGRWARAGEPARGVALVAPLIEAIDPGEGFPLHTEAVALARG